MRVIAKTLVLLVLCASAWAQEKSSDELAAQKVNAAPQKLVPEPPMLGPHMARGERWPIISGGHHSPNMVWHNGPILTTTATKAIFWGKSWSNASFVGDKMTGLDSFYAGLAGSGYGRTSDEYTGTNGQVTASVTTSTHLVDTSAASGGGSTSAILAEVCKMISNPVANGYYPVYVDLPRSGNYCAWHSWGSCGSTMVQFAFFWNLDGDAGCDPQDASGLHSQGLAALANVSGHEISETRTDPQGTGWFDRSGQENGDKCSWIFGTPLLTFSNGSQWKVQGNWSNYAYNNLIGYANMSGQNGCLDGGNYPAVSP